MSKYYTIITDKGKQKISAAIIANGKINLRKMYFGDGNGSNYNPTSDQTQLVNKLYETEILSVSVDETNDSYVVTQAIVPPNIGNFYIREVGLIDGDGDLIAIASIPEVFKPVIESGSIRELVVKVLIKVANSSVIEIKVSEGLIEGTITADAFAMYGLRVINKTTGVTTLEITEDGEVNAVFNNVKIGSSSIISLISSALTDANGYTDGKYTELMQTIDEFKFTIDDVTKLANATVTIDLEGIKVEMKENEISKGYARINSEGLSIYDSSDKMMAWFGDNETAYIDKVNTNDINCSKMLRKCGTGERPYTFYLAPEATGDGSGINADNKASSFNDLMKFIKNTYGEYFWRQDLSIDVAAGSYDEHFYIGGWLGTGVLHVNFNKDAILNGGITVEENNMFVNLNGSGNFSTSGAIIENKWVTVSGDTIYFRNSNGRVTGFRSRNGKYYEYHFIRADFGASVVAYHNDIVGYQGLSYATTASSIYAYDNRGDTYALSNGSSASTLTTAGSIPEMEGNSPFLNYKAVVKTEQNTYKTNSLWIPKVIVTPPPTPEVPDPPPETIIPPPPPPVLKTFNQSFTATKIYTTVEGSGSGTSVKTDKTGQSHWGSYKNHRGHAIIPDSLSRTLEGAESWTINVKLRRWGTKHGQYGAIPVPKFVTTPGTTNTYNCGKAFALGNTFTVYVGDDLNNKIKNGTVKDLQFWSTAANDYSFYDSVVFEVTYRKYV